MVGDALGEIPVVKHRLPRQNPCMRTDPKLATADREIGERIGTAVQSLDRIPVGGEEVLEAWRAFFEDAAAGRAYPRAVLYVHVPWCRTKCSYCECNSAPVISRSQLAEYVCDLKREIAIISPLAARHPFDALYIGGGTPSLLDPSSLDDVVGEVLSAFSRAQGFHLTCEANPESLTDEHVAVLRKRGCRRLSLGIQSFSSAVLQNIGRSYQTRESVIRAVRAVRREPSLTLNVDLVAGLPGDDEQTFAASVSAAIDLSPDSIVIYPWNPQCSALEACGCLETPALASRRDALFGVAAETIARRWTDRLQIPAPFGKLTPRTWIRNPDPAAQNVYTVLREEKCASVLGLGFGAESKIHARLVVDHGLDVGAWSHAVRTGTLPSCNGRRLTLEIEQQMFAARYLAAPCDRHISTFREVFGSEPHEVFPDADFSIPASPASSPATDSVKLAFVEDLVLDKCVQAQASATAGRPTGGTAVSAHPAFAEPDSICLRIGTACNCHCPACPWRGANLPEVSTEAVLRALTDGAKKGVQALNVVGPEPTLDHRLPGIARRAHAMGFQSVVCWTNGRRFAYEPYATKVVTAGVNAAVVSLYGADARSHDDAVQVDGAWQESISGIRRLVDLIGLGLRVRIVVVAENLGRVPDAIQRAAELGVRRLLIDFAMSVSLQQLSAVHDALSASSSSFACVYRNGRPCL